MSKTDMASPAHALPQPQPTTSALNDSNSLPNTNPNTDNAGLVEPSTLAPAGQLKESTPDSSPTTWAKGGKQTKVAQPSTIVPPNPHEPGNLPSAIIPAPAKIVAIVTQKEELREPCENQLPALHESLDGPVSLVDSTQESTMIFGSKTSAQRRRNLANTNALTNYEADMTSKDRQKQKDAVRAYLTERVKKNWDWEWPQPDESSPESLPAPPNVEGTDTGEKQWRERDEWLSNASEDEDKTGMPSYVASPDTPSTRHSQFRFESADGLGDDIKRINWERKQRRKKRLADELAWNNGLQCFVARRDAWTGARKVYRSNQGKTVLKLGKRPSVISADGSSSTAIENEDTIIEKTEDEDEWEDDIEVPVAPPILPPENQMRASISPSAYNTIYDKIILQQMTPLCPMNLKDVIRSCVQGWKRDGEWPPKPTIPEPRKKGRKMSVASLFGINSHEKDEHLKAEHEKDKGTRETHEKKASTGSGIRKSIQKMLNLGHNANASSGSSSRKLSKGGSPSPRPPAAGV